MFTTPARNTETLTQSAIRLYPAQYVAAWTAHDGTPLVIRPIRPADEPLMVAFHRELSAQSVYFRYLYSMALDQRVGHERLLRMCLIDYDRQLALIAEATDPATGTRTILGVGRLIKLDSTDAAEFAILVTDRFQRRGLGSELLRRLIQVGRDESLGRIVGEIHPDNRGMLHICEQLGFRLRRTLGESVRAEIAL